MADPLSDAAPEAPPGGPKGSPPLGSLYDPDFVARTLHAMIEGDFLTALRRMPPGEAFPTLEMTLTHPLDPTEAVKFTVGIEYAGPERREGGDA